MGALALHFSEASHNEKAWHYCLIAAEKASEIFANVEAAQFYERALTAGPQIRNLDPAGTSHDMDRARLRARGRGPLRPFIRSPPPRIQPVAGRPCSRKEALRAAGPVARAHGVVHSGNEGDGGRASACEGGHL